MNNKRILVRIFIALIFLIDFWGCSVRNTETRTISDFTENWKFHLGDVENAQSIQLEDSHWRTLNLPHDWSIEGKFDKDHLAGAGGGALPGGIGWYRKEFTIPLTDSSKSFFIEFDGVYQNSEVWINEYYLGKRPNGYISFDYELTDYLNFGQNPNIISVKVDNSQQPNSRWYSGSGIYRNVRLIALNNIYIKKWGTYITTQEVKKNNATIKIEIEAVNKTSQKRTVSINTSIKDKENSEVGSFINFTTIPSDSTIVISQELNIDIPKLWSIEDPYLYNAVTSIENDKQELDRYQTSFGIRTFKFDVDKGFYLNGKQTKIKGVCNHHDLGALGTAVNVRAIERQLEILKGMGVNGIRTAHNPPAPELLDLCDKMGFIVMDEVFDMWKNKKTKFDYAQYWDKWHERDLKDFILRDRNHPSIFIWSIGNEVIEQYNKSDSLGSVIAQKLSSIVKTFDKTRPITAACNNTDVDNPVLKSEALDLIGFNYNHEKYVDFQKQFPGKKFIATETESSLHTRGSYDMPSDSIRRWPIRWDLPFTTGNENLTCSAYDNCSAPWGSTHEETWKVVKDLDFVSGMFTWTGFDYLGEPTPYSWPAKSSYFGIIDLAGFPKDAYYLYKSEWTQDTVLHIFPHWNWELDKEIDIWAYTNCDEVELFLNNQSLGAKQKNDDNIHLEWKVTYKPGTLKAIGRVSNNDVITKIVNTASEPYSIQLIPDRNIIKADGKDLSFVTVNILDKDSNLVPYADNLVNFNISGNGKIIGVDNGLQTSLESFKESYRKAFNGKCLVIVQSNNNEGTIILSAESEGLQNSTATIISK
jgi:beta-galactosidase